MKRKINISTRKYPNTFAIVDSRMYKVLNKHKWYAFKRDKTHSSLYARRSISIKNGFVDHVLMHRQILNAYTGIQVDHRNGNTLDNRMNNLRLCSKLDNAKNRKVNYNSNTGYKGVIFRKDTKKYRARIKSDGEAYSLGSFNTALEAAKAYNDAALELHGEFAYLNDIGRSEC